MIADFLTAMVGTIGFSLLFGVPTKYYPLCGLIGAAGWMVYLALTRAGEDATVAVFLATVLAISLSRLAAVQCKCPVTVFLIAGIIPLVPGAGIYWFTYYLVVNQMEKAAESGFSAFKSAVAIVLGIVVVFEIPQKVFQIGRKKSS